MIVQDAGVSGLGFSVKPPKRLRKVLGAVAKVAAVAAPALLIPGVGAAASKLVGGVASAAVRSAAAVARGARTATGSVGVAVRQQVQKAARERAAAKVVGIAARAGARRAMTADRAAKGAIQVQEIARRQRMKRDHAAPNRLSNGVKLAVAGAGAAAVFGAMRQRRRKLTPASLPPAGAVATNVDTINTTPAPVLVSTVENIPTQAVAPAALAPISRPAGVESDASSTGDMAGSLVPILLLGGAAFFLMGKRR